LHDTDRHLARPAGREPHRIGKLPGGRYTPAQCIFKDFAMKRLISSLAALVAVACLVSACGQKGPLYLPDPDQDPAEQAQSSQKQPASKAHKHDVYQ
jgi:predicted small lipoprotein YifL